jgi:hypothetical protein
MLSLNVANGWTEGFDGSFPPAAKMLKLVNRKII